MSGTLLTGAVLASVVAVAAVRETVVSSAKPISIDVAAVDAFIDNRMTATGTPGLGLAITQGDRVLYLRGYGTADSGRPVEPDTPFLIASLSKSFTAVAVLQLVEDGRVELDAPVRRYLPDFRVGDAAASRRITIRHLLNHTSGMGDAGFPHMTLPQPSTIQERVATLAQARLVAEPGTRFNYFDPNYAVLARVVEVVSGESFSAYLERALFTPLGMDSTRGVVQTRDLPERVPDLAQGHLAVFGLTVPWDEMDGYLAGSTGIASTPADMAQYLMFQSGAHPAAGDVLPRSRIAEMHEPPAGVASDYAMGWVRMDGPDEILHHNGVLGTFHADAVLVPQAGIGIALLYNSSHALASYDATWRGLLELIGGDTPASTLLDARIIEIAFGVFTAAGIVIRLRGMPGTGRRPVKGSGAAVRRALRVAWALLPGAALVGLSPLVGAVSGRMFSFAQLAAAMPGPTIWLAANAVLGVAQAGLLLGRWRRVAKEV